MELDNGQAEGRRPKPFPHLWSFSLGPRQAARPFLHLSVQSELQPPPHLLHMLGPGPNPLQGAKCDSHAQTHTLCSVDFPLITLQVSVKTSPPQGQFSPPLHQTSEDPAYHTSHAALLPYVLPVSACNYTSL